MSNTPPVTFESGAMAEVRRLAAALSAESERLTLALNTLKTIRFAAQDADIRKLANEAIVNDEKLGRRQA